jgi:hypothetical protein
MARSAQDLHADRLKGAGPGSSAGAAPGGAAAKGECVQAGEAARQPDQASACGKGGVSGGAVEVPPVLWQNLAVLHQGVEVIERLAGDRGLESLYALAPVGLVHHGAGSHFRHIHDLYLCFLRDVESQRVDYDQRERDERFEREPRHALKVLRQTVEKLERLGAGLPFSASGRRLDLHLPIEVKMDVEPHDREPFTASTPLRELRFLLSHTIHHYALIAMILKVQGFDCGAKFGVAPSTLRFWEQSPGCAPQAGSGG